MKKTESKHRDLQKTPAEKGLKKSLKDIIKEITAISEPVIESSGFELVHLEFQRESGGKVLRIYLDKPGGIRLDDCVDVSRELSDILDVMLEDAGPYRLEVSSPGIERPLSRLKDFERFIGEKIKIRIDKPFLNDRPNQKNIKGLIHHVNGDLVLIKPEDAKYKEEMLEIPFSRIIKANLVPDVK